MGTVLGSVNTLTLLDATVGESLDVRALSLSLEGESTIAGDVQYVSRAPLTQSIDTSVAGEIVRSGSALPAENQGRLSGLLLVMIMVSAVVWQLLFARPSYQIVRTARQQPFLAATVGVASLLLVPFAAALLLVSVFGAMISAISSLGLILAFLVALLLVPVAVADWVFNRSQKTLNKISLAKFGVGLLGVGLVLLVPIIGALTVIGVAVYLLGGIVLWIVTKQT
jgi:hypothetical protein